MKFFEAVEIARKTGKKIGVMRCDRLCNIVEWKSGTLNWDNSSQVIFIDGDVLDADWQVIEPPPKEYDFAEAYQMMKAGKWMKAVNTDVMYSFFRGRLEYRIGKDSCISLADAIDINAIDSKWIEVLQ